MEWKSVRSLPRADLPELEAISNVEAEPSSES
jgi:hypothetical protein